MVDSIVHQNIALNTQIQECHQQLEFWTQKLQNLQEQRVERQHQRLIIAMLRDDPATTWDMLPKAQRTKDVVLAILKYHPYFFGRSPWQVRGFLPLPTSTNGGREDHALLPSEFREDRDIILAYAKGENDGDTGFVIPGCVWDDEEIVSIVCSNCRSLRCK